MPALNSWASFPAPSLLFWSRLPYLENKFCYSTRCHGLQLHLGLPHVHHVSRWHQEITLSGWAIPLRSLEMHSVVFPRWQDHLTIQFLECLISKQYIARAWLSPQQLTLSNWVDPIRTVQSGEHVVKMSQSVWNHKKFVHAVVRMWILHHELVFN